jgi:carbamoyltransferase
MRDLCLAGGVALNCVGNGRILREGPFDQIWIQPAAGDAGGALGVAMSLWHRYLGKPRESAESLGTWERPSPQKAGTPRYADGMSGSYLGPRFSESEIQKFLDANGCPARRLAPAALADEVAALMAEEKVVGLMQGRMEFGPRALGNRSLLADPRRPEMRNILNQKVKHREDFRPFAPSVMAEHADEWFEVGTPTTSHEFMLFAPPVRHEQRKRIPAIVHQDGTARVQLVSRKSNPRFHELISCFHEQTGVPVVINTSFNDSEPIVCTPMDAIVTFRKSGIDALFMDDVVLTAKG